MKYQCEQCGACCKLAYMKVEQGECLPLKENGHCGHLIEDNGKYSCAIFETRPDTCRSEYAMKKFNLTNEQYVPLANQAREILRQIVR
jgi:Fe-S-cluster containining protein